MVVASANVQRFIFLISFHCFQLFQLEGVGHFKIFEWYEDTIISYDGEKYVVEFSYDGEKQRLSERAFERHAIDIISIPGEDKNNISTYPPQKYRIPYCIHGLVGVWGVPVCYWLACTL